MPQAVHTMKNLAGLSAQQAADLQRRNGRNVLVASGERKVWHIVRDIFWEPMFLLLLIATTLYFIIGQWREGYMTLVAVLLVTAISLYQDMRSSHALEALNRYTRHKVKVIRDGALVEMPAEELVQGDLVLLEEGDTVPADAELLQGNDVSMDEAIITGESLPVAKSPGNGERQLLQGTTLTSGSCYARVTAIGADTVLGRMGKSVSGYTPMKTLLQQQVGGYVRLLAIFGIAAFWLIFAANYLHGSGLVESLLLALTLAMAAVPEEIPVAFSSFMALGAYQLSRIGIIVRRPQVTENLGAVSVICLDKTGTITENKMVVAEIYQYEGEKLELVTAGEAYQRILLYARLASELHPFDAMEAAIVDAYSQVNGLPEPKQIFEYPLEGRPPMMTHVHHLDGKLVVAGKGATERMLKVCRLEGDVAAGLLRKVSDIAAKGYRVLGVAGAASDDGKLPALQDGFAWKLFGFVCLNDPPKVGVDKAITSFYKSGIAVKLLTGDYLETALNIAGRVGMNNRLQALTGTEVMQMSDAQLRNVVSDVSVFARMFPEAKERVVKALQALGELVAMTGDGVNDAPALKAADIGIAMGKRGTTTAREVADVIITDDNIDRLMDAIVQGRKIFANLKKSIRYIISIHIPIILTAALPVLLGWKYPNVFTPIHVIFLELIMGPTCSIFFEREPVELSVVYGGPRKRSDGVFKREELVTSVIQGIVIAVVVLGVYYAEMTAGSSLQEVRTMVFLTLLFANVFLTFSDRSLTDTILDTIRYKNSLAPWVAGSSLLFIALLLFVPPVQALFGLVRLPYAAIVMCAIAGLLSVSWFEAYKRSKTFPAYG